MKKILFLISSCLSIAAHCQLYVQQGAGLYLDNANITVQGDVISFDSIKGSGKLVMKGTSIQQLSMNGNAVPSIEVDNMQHVALQSNLEILKEVLFTTGKLQTDNYDLLLDYNCAINGYSASSYIATTGTGQLKRKINADVINYIFPIGDINNYRPAYFTSTGATYSNAVAGVRTDGQQSPNSPKNLNNYLLAYWPVTTSGFLGGTLRLTGQYNNTIDVAGTETSLKGYFYNGIQWSSANETHDYTTHTVSTKLTAGSGELYAMNSFVMAGAKAFLQGPYNSGTGLMSDALRSASYIPTTSPYRNAPFTTNALFKAVNNINIETISPTVFSDQSLISYNGDNIVDWVFLELRNTISPGNTVVATRSALIQRDGDIVDLDGKSPVNFNDVLPGNYILVIKHRNHMALSINLSGYKALTELKTDVVNNGNFDFSTPSSIYNPPNSPLTVAYAQSGSKSLLWSGDVSNNGQLKYINTGNDRILVLNSLGSVESATKNGYFREDVNMNGQVKYINTGNDRILILNNLGSVESATKSQKIPN